MLYTFTHYATLYELYVGLLRALIAVAVALSMLISVDRIYKVCHPTPSATHCLVDIPGSTFLSRMCAPAGPDVPQNSCKDEIDGQEAGA